MRRQLPHPTPIRIALPICAPQWGGTETRTLVAHDGKLFAGNGYWKDAPVPEGTPGAQILVLDNPQAAWRVDASFDDVLPDGRRRHLAISALTGR